MTRSTRAALTAAAALAFVLSIAAANYATSTYGMVPVGFALVATAGTYFAGLTLVLRDIVQDLAGRTPLRTAVLLVLLIGVGGVLSYVLADPMIAVASVVAFVVSELVDAAIYSPLRDRGFVRAAFTSNVAGAIVDTWLFLAIAGFAIDRYAVAGQLVGKLLLGTLVVLAWGGVRALLREPVDAVRA